MHQHPNHPANGIYVADGFDIRIRTDRRHLVVEDGYIGERRATRFSRATSRLRRLVVIGHTGYLTLEAIRWVTDVGAHLIHIDTSGVVRATTARGELDHPALRRAQAAAPETYVGLEIARELLTTKIRGQAEVAMGLDATAAEAIADRERQLAATTTLPEVRLIESQAASTYWSAWRGVQVLFSNHDRHRVPDYWATFGRRVSPLTGSPRSAADPINAMLNYLYALLEAESRIALTTVGLDPGLGIVHTDQRARDSLALDLMEASRPAVDGYLLKLLGQPFSASDFYETRAGQCRIAPRLTRQLAATLPTWNDAVVPHAEVIGRLLAGSIGEKPPPTLLSGRNRRAARGETFRPSRSPRTPLPTAVCHDCGREVPNRQRRCAACHQVANMRRLVIQQAKEIERRRELGDHPSARAEVRARIGASQRAQAQRRQMAGEESDGFGYGVSGFVRLVLPRIQALSPRVLAAATGLSPGYCALIRDGKRIPHRRHWAALQLAGLRAEDEDRGRPEVTIRPPRDTEGTREHHG